MANPALDSGCPTRILSIETFYCCKDIIYEILPPKILQLYCTLDIRKYKRGKDDNGNRQINVANDIKLKNDFDIRRKLLEDIDYGGKIAKKSFPLKY